jgi:DNA-binding transcriptional LysR family regulator
VLEDWCPVFQGYHLYYPKRRHFSSAMAVLVEELRFRRSPRRRVEFG